MYWVMLSAWVNMVIIIVVNKAIGQVILWAKTNNPLVNIVRATSTNPTSLDIQHLIWHRTVVIVGLGLNCGGSASYGFKPATLAFNEKGKEKSFRPRADAFSIKKKNTTKHNAAEKNFIFTSPTNKKSRLAFLQAWKLHRSDYEQAAPIQVELPPVNIDAIWPAPTIVTTPVAITNTRPQFTLPKNAPIPRKKIATVAITSSKLLPIRQLYTLHILPPRSKVPLAEASSGDRTVSTANASINIFVFSLVIVNPPFDYFMKL